MKRPIPILLLIADYIWTILFGWWEFFTSPSKSMISHLVVALAATLLFASIAWGLWNFREVARRCVVVLKQIALWGSVIAGAMIFLKFGGIGHAVSFALMAISAFIAFRYLQQPDVCALFAEENPHRKDASAATSSIYALDSKWIIWLLCSVCMYLIPLIQSH